MPATLVIVALLVLWQLAVDLLQVKEYILPSPWSALKALDRPTYQWPANFLTTLCAVLGAFVLSAVLGVALAVLTVWNRLLMRTVMPVLVLFNTLPKIALAPLFVLWLADATHDRRHLRQCQAREADQGLGGLHQRLQQQDQANLASLTTRRRSSSRTRP
jgi:ABC-type nitrate/sulfonate/bicarbonate transport system permease component